MSQNTFASLLVDSSRSVANMVVDYVGENPELLKELFDLAMKFEGKVSMRAARAFDLCDEARPGLASDFVPGLYFKIEEIPHQGVLRCFMRLLTRYDLPEDDEVLGRFFDFCLRTSRNSSWDVAIRYYAMHGTYRTCLLEPDLRFELFPFYEDIAKEEGKGLRLRANDFLRELDEKFGREV